MLLLCGHCANLILKITVLSGRNLEESLGSACTINVSIILTILFISVILRMRKLRLQKGQPFAQIMVHAGVMTVEVFLEFAALLFSVRVDAVTLAELSGGSYLPLESPLEPEHKVPLF